MGGFLRRRSTAAKLVLAALAGAVAMAPVTVLASHDFTDVPDTHTFHDEISAVAGAGIAGPFPDGTYRPSNALTRQAMAAFLERGLSRAGLTTGSRLIGNAAGQTRRAEVASTSLDAGAAGDGNGFVLVRGSATARTGSVASCPCNVVVSLALNGIAVSSTDLTVPGVADEAGGASATASLETFLPLAADASASYQLVASTTDSNVPTITVTGRISAQYVPLGPDGDNSQTYGFTCAGFESEPNDTTASADAVGSDGCVRGSIVGTNFDFFTIGVASGEVLTLETRSVDGAGCEGDSIVSLHDVNGAEIASNDDSGVGVCSRLVASGLTTGTYFLRVSAFSPNDRFDYRLTAIAAAPAAAGTAEPVGDVDDVAKESR